ncbi:MAG: hypothetical protein ABIK44_00115 [candidate division WOR-3 bacterium]
MSKVQSLILFSALLATLFDLLAACTIGAFGPGATIDGRPILWKNRDVNNPDQEIGFFNRGRFRFVANVYAGETLNVWAGINEKGFAIMNSNSFNLGGDGAADDGNVMSLALANCATIDDFAKLLDSLNVVGRETPANYGVFDSTGATAIFEASNTYYTRCNVADDSLGLLLRANYSMSGSPNRQVGRERWERAMQLTVPARRANRIDARFVIQTLARDLGTVNFNPYPLPFEGRYHDLDSGCVPTDSTICRPKTRAAFVLVGPRPDRPAAAGMMWVLLGSPLATLPIPVWVSAGRVPNALNGQFRSQICDEAQLLYRYLCSDPNHPDAINTFRLADLLAEFARTESTIFSLVAQKESIWGPAGPTPAQAESTTTTICNLVLAAYTSFWENLARTQRKDVPKLCIIPTISRNSVTLTWPTGTEVRWVRVYNSAGQLVHQRSPVSGNNLLVLSGLGAGTYFAVVAQPEPVTIPFLLTD